MGILQLLKRTDFAGIESFLLNLFEREIYTKSLKNTFLKLIFEKDSVHEVYVRLYIISLRLSNLRCVKSYCRFLKAIKVWLERGDWQKILI